MANAVSQFVTNIAAQVGEAVFSATGSAALSRAAAAAVEFTAQAAISLATLTAVNALTGPSLPKPSQARIPFRQTVPPRVSGFGRVRLSGPYVCFEEYDGDSFDVIAIHTGAIDAIETRYLHDDEISVGSGTINDTTYSDVVSFAGTGPQYEQALRWSETLGVSTETAHAPITPLPTWSASHRGDGIASIALFCAGTKRERFASVYPYGLPQPSVLARLQTCFDPRDVAHDPADRSTWSWSENPIEEIATYLISDDTGGMGQDYTRRIAPSLSAWQAAATACDGSVSLKAGGSEARYRAGGSYAHTSPHSDVLGALLASCDGWMAENGDGSLTIKAGEYEAPSLTLTADHIIAWSWQRHRPDEEAANEFIGTYTSPDHAYTEIDCDPWREEAEILAQGAVRQERVNLNWVPSHAQARRLLKRRARKMRAGRGSVTTTLYGLQAFNERYVRIQNPEHPAMADVVCEVVQLRVDFRNARVELNLVEVDSSIDDWDPATEEGTAPTTADATAIVIPSTPVIDSISVLTTGGLRIQINVTTPSQPNLNYYVRLRTTDGGDPPVYGAYQQQFFFEADTSGSTIPLITSVLAEATYEVEVAAQATGGGLTAFSAPMTVDVSAASAPTTPGGGTGGTL